MLAYNPVKHAASKHVELADHYVREQVERGFITVSHIEGKNMIADYLTKQLPRQQTVGDRLLDINFAEDIFRCIVEFFASSVTQKFRRACRHIHLHLQTLFYYLLTFAAQKYSAMAIAIFDWQNSMMTIFYCPTWLTSKRV